MKTIIKGIMAGFMISIAASVYLSIDNKVIGALMFSIGLLSIVVMDYNLFTGKAGYFPVLKVSYLITVLVSNTIGCAFYSLIYRCTSSGNIVSNKALELCNTKFSASILSMFLSAILCGCLMFIAVHSFNKYKDIIGLITLILCVSGFIIAGYEHSIADIAYLCLGSNHIPSVDTFVKLGVIIIGNFIGAVGTKYTLKNYKSGESYGAKDL